MRVLHVIDSLRGGGAEKLLEVSLPHASVAGLEPRVLYLQNETACLPGLVAGGVPTMNLDEVYRPLRKGPRERARDVERILAWFDGWRPDILHGHLHGAYLFTPWLAQRLKVPYVLSDHLAGDPWQINQSLRGKILRRRYVGAYRNAAAVVCVSPAVESYLLETMGLRGLKTEVVLNCVDAVFFEPVPASAEKIYDLVVVGRLSDQKNQLFALDVLAELVRNGRKAKMAIVGEGSLRSAIEAKIQALGLSRNVEMLGRKSSLDLRDVYDQSRILFMPSLAEGAGLVAIEAMARGLHVVASDLPALRDTCGGYPSASLVPVNDLSEHRDAVLAALEEPLPEVAPAALEEHTPDFHNRRMAEVYHHVLLQGCQPNTSLPEVFPTP